VVVGLGGKEAMLATTTSRKRLVALGLLLNFFSFDRVYPQNVPTPQTLEAASRMQPSAEQNCASRLATARLANDFSLDTGFEFAESVAIHRAEKSGFLEESCGTMRLAAPLSSLLATKTESRCIAATTWASDVATGCPGSRDGIAEVVPGERLLSGKEGAEIRRAREEVLAILSEPNACSTWFAGKDQAAESTFASLSFLVDRQGPESVFGWENRSLMIIRQPYVASATQDGGAYTEITINANGAFYRALARFQKLSAEGGPPLSITEHWLTVGPYAGNTLEARILTLLHELGHIVGLLPPDADDLDRKSVQNTNEVLRHCRPQIEAVAKHARETAREK
jgi:hypothetical protein